MPVMQLRDPALVPASTGATKAPPARAALRQQLACLLEAFDQVDMAEIERRLANLASEASQVAGLREKEHASQAHSSADQQMLASATHESYRVNADLANRCGAAVGWRWRRDGASSWSYVDGELGKERLAWLSRFGHHTELLYNFPLEKVDLLLGAASRSGLHTYLLSEDVSTVSAVLSRFVLEVIGGPPRSF